MTPFEGSAQLDLTHPLGGVALFAVAARTWVRHLPVFLALALVVVAPLYVLVDWVWLDLDPYPDGLLAIVSFVEHGVVIPALVTAMHVVAVQDLGRGERPRIRHSAAVALRLAPWLVLVVTAYVVAVVLGAIAVLIPGLIAAVRLYFGAQSVVVDGAKGLQGLYNSADLTGEWRWVRTLAVLAVLWVVAYGIDAALTPAYEAAGSDALWIGVGIVERTIVVSFAALVGTLLFFDLRVRRALKDAATNGRARRDP